MNFINSLMSVGFLTGIIFIIVGLITFYFPPKKINHLYGYRTSNSMKSQKRWEVAQLNSSKLMILIGFVLFAISILLGFTKIEFHIITAIETTSLIISIAILFIYVENKIKKIH